MRLTPHFQTQFMLIGGDFNKKAKQLLSALAELSGGEAGADIPVKKLNENIGLGRNEIRNLLEYLENKECLEISTIGGPLLYGHVRITEKGLTKAE